MPAIVEIINKLVVEQQSQKDNLVRFANTVIEASQLATFEMLEIGTYKGNGGLNWRM